MIPRHRLVLALALVLGAAPAAADDGDRPSEDELFGGTPAPDRPSEDALFGGDSDRPSEDALFGGDSDRPSDADVFDAEGDSDRPSDATLLSGQSFSLTEDAAPEDPLSIGGMLYLRFRASGREGEALRDVSFSSPNLLDVYFDARVNDRLRGFASFRVTETGIPAESEFSVDPVPVTTIVETCGGQVTSTSDVDSPAELAAALGLTEDTVCVTTGYGLTQLWLRTDLRRRVFFTVGRQFVKWGTGRFWNPTDFLQPVARDPLAPFDVRSGTDMVKLQIPWERRGWNFYAVALTDRFLLPASVTTDEEDTPTLGTLSNIGAAARAEIVLGTMELGVDGIAKAASRPKLGVDVSAGLGPVDLYAEAAFRWGSDRAVYERVEDADLDGDGAPDAVWEPYEPEGLQPAVTAGVGWSGLITDTTPINVGAEAYYNALGYDDPTAYLTLFLNGDYVPFQVGRYYGAVFVNLPGPGKWDDGSFTLSALGNISDRSMLTRLDVSWLIHRLLRLEVYGAVHAGSESGEFHQAVDYTIPAAPPVIPEPIHFQLDPPLWDAGIALRLNL